MRILVIGGTAHIGRWVVRALQRARVSQEVHCLVAPPVTSKARDADNALWGDTTKLSRVYARPFRSLDTMSRSAGAVLDDAIAVADRSALRNDDQIHAELSW